MNLTPRQQVKYLDKNGQVKTGVIASISNSKRLIQLSKSNVISFDQIID